MNLNKKRRECTSIVIFIVTSVFILPSVQQSVFANNGKEIALKLSDSQFILLPGKNVQQVKLTTTSVSYTHLTLPTIYSV